MISGTPEERQNVPNRYSSSSYQETLIFKTDCMETFNSGGQTSLFPPSLPNSKHQPLTIAGQLLFRSALLLYR